MRHERTTARPRSGEKAIGFSVIHLPYRHGAVGLELPSRQLTYAGNPRNNLRCHVITSLAAKLERL